MTEYTECRTTAEIGNRALFVGYILSAFRLRGQEEHPYADLIDGFRGSLQRSDRELLTRGDWPEELQRDLLWQTECLHVLLWSLGKVSALLPMDTMESREPIVAEDVIANGQPFFALDPNAQAMTGEIVTERARALYWIWKDFDDWWNPVLDT